MDIGAKLQQKSRESIQAQLLWLWDSVDNDISVTKQEAKKKKKVT